MFKLVSIMTREEYLAWCKNCQKRSFDLNKGVTCLLTSEIASFTEQCDQFDFDSKEFKKNVVSDISSMLESPNDYFEKPKKINWKKYPTKQFLPVEFKIKNANPILLIYLIILMDLLVVGFLHYDEIKDFYITIVELKSILMYLFWFVATSMLSIVMLYARMMDKEVKIYLNDQGIKIENSSLCLWESTEVNVIYIQNDNSMKKYLILHQMNQKSIRYSIEGLELSPKKILHLIELYREN